MALRGSAFLGAYFGDMAHSPALRTVPAGVPGVTYTYAQDQTQGVLQWTDPATGTLASLPLTSFQTADGQTIGRYGIDAQGVGNQPVFDYEAVQALVAGALLDGVPGSGPGSSPAVPLPGTAIAPPGDLPSAAGHLFLGTPYPPAVDDPSTALRSEPGASDGTAPNGTTGGSLANAPVNLGANLNDLVFGGAQGGADMTAPPVTGLDTPADGASTVPVAAGVGGSSGDGGLAGVGAGPGSPAAPAGSTVAPTTSPMAIAGRDGVGMASTAAPPLPASSPPLIPPQMQTPQESFPAAPSAAQPTIFSTPIAPPLPTTLITTPAPALPHVEQGPGADGVQGPQIVSMAAPTPRDGVVGGKPTGMPEVPDPRDNQAKQEGIRLQNASGNALAAAGYRVEWNPELRPEDKIPDEKDPDMRLGNNIADVVAPTSSDEDQVRKALSRKISSGQAYHLVLNLGRTDVTLDEVEALLQRKPIADLQELIVIEKDGAISRVLPDPEQISPASPSPTPPVP